LHAAILPTVVNRLIRFKKAIQNFYAKWTFAIAAASAAMLLHFWGELSWTASAIFIPGLYLAVGLAANETSKWISENISPGSEGGLSRLYPRVWSFSLELARPFLNEIHSKLSEKGSDHARGFSPVDEVLDRLVIDEYLNRLRVHRWTFLGEGQSYTMFDIDKSPGSHWNFDKHHGRALWTYSTEEMNLGKLTLSCSWERNPVTKDPYLQLVLWLNFWHDKERDVTQDILFKVPLEPRRLQDNAERTVYVQGEGGREFKAGDLEFYPYDEDDWKSPGEEKERWDWHLHMKTFHTY
jgi:hypothetical protein